MQLEMLRFSSNKKNIIIAQQSKFASITMVMEFATRSYIPYSYIS